METTSTIGAGTIVRGSVHGDGDLDIQGRVEGSVDVTGELSIAEGALIKSDVRGRRVTVRGAIAGNVSATEAIVLEAGARVVGDLTAPQIGIRPGALLRGLVSSGTSPAADARASRVQPARAAQAVARPAARPVSPKPAARPAPPGPPPVRVEAPKPAPPPMPPPAVEEEEEATPAAEHGAGPPPPVVPQIRKGAKASLRRKNGR